MHTTYTNKGVELIEVLIVNKLSSISVVGIILDYIVDYCWKEGVGNQVECIMKWFEGNSYLFVDCTGIDNVSFKNRQRIVYNLFNYRTFKRFLLYINNTGLSNVNTVSTVFKGALFAEREVFDLYGVRFKKHPDMRRILTDYGFVGHPFKKDYPLSGYMQMAFSSIKKKLKKEKLKLLQELRVFDWNMSWAHMYVEAGNKLVMVLFVFLIVLLIFVSFLLKDDQRIFLALLKKKRFEIYGEGWVCTEKLLKDISRQNVSKLARAVRDKAIFLNWVKNDNNFSRETPFSEKEMPRSEMEKEGNQIFQEMVSDSLNYGKEKRAKEENSEVTAVGVGVKKDNNFSREREARRDLVKEKYLSYLEEMQMSEMEKKRYRIFMEEIPMSEMEKERYRIFLEKERYRIFQENGGLSSERLFLEKMQIIEPMSEMEKEWYRIYLEKEGNQIFQEMVSDSLNYGKGKRGKEENSEVTAVGVGVKKDRKGKRGKEGNLEVTEVAVGVKKDRKGKRGKE
jgi:NADH:ubiquinone oxidoreductase subunit C